MDKCLIFKTHRGTYTYMHAFIFACTHMCIYAHTHIYWHICECMILTIYDHIYYHSANESFCFSHNAIQIPLASCPWYLLSGISFLLITLKLDQFSMSGSHSCPLNSCASAWQKLPGSSGRVLCVFGIFSVPLMSTAMWIPAVWGSFLLDTEVV